MSEQEEDQNSWIPAIRDYIEFKEGEAQCRIDSSLVCKYVQKVFRPSNFVRHFRNEHPRISMEKGFFRKCYKKDRELERPDQLDSSAAAPSQQRLVAERVVDFIVRRAGTICCNINPTSECSYRQTHYFRKHYFLHHFVSRHPKKAREHGLFIMKPSTGRSREVKERSEKPPIDVESGIDATVRKHIRLDGTKHLCRISADFCFYFQTQFNSHNFYRHFYTVHAPEAAKNGISRENYLDLVNGPPQTEEPVDRSMETNSTSFDDQLIGASDSESVDNSPIKVQKEVEARTMKDMVDECVRKEGDITYCAIDDGKNCLYYQVRLNNTNFSRHIRKLHTEEAKRRGFFLPTIHSKRKRTSEAKSVSNKIKEIKKRKSILGDMVNECVRHEGTVTYCQIDENSECKFSQKLFNPSNFSRHFRLKHPNVADERGFFKLRPDVKTEKKERRLGDMVEECVRREGSVTYCQIDPHSECSFMLKMFHPANFKHHFLAKHPGEAEKKGFCKRHFIVKAKSKRALGVGVVDPQKLKLADKVPDFILRRKTHSGRTRYLCNLQPDSGCLYYETLLHIGNRYRFVNHFIRKHPDAAMACFVQSTRYTETDLPEDDPATITQQSDIQQRACSSKKKRTPIRALVDKLVTKEGVAARCNIRPDSGCTYSQKLYTPFNFVRHFYTKHPIAFVEHGFSFHESMLGKSDNKRNESETIVEPPEEESVAIKEEFVIGEGFVVKAELEEAMAVDDSLSVSEIKQEFDPLSEVDHCGFVASERFGVEEAEGYGGNESLSNVNYETTASESGSHADRSRGNVLEFIRKEGSFFHCAINDEKDCGYFQTRLQKTNFGRHFRNVHREAALRHGFFKKPDEDAWGKKTFTDSVQKSTSEMVEECVREEEHVIYCQINSESECTYSQQSFNAPNFARHFRQVHPEEAQERGFFKCFYQSPGSGRRRSAQQTHRDMVIKNTLVNEGGVHCRIAGYCPYVQKRLMTSNFERHFCRKHPKEAVEKGFSKAQGEALTQIKKRISTQKFEILWKECVAKDELGAYCRLVPGCTFFQRIFTRDKFRLHFFQMHNEEAVQKGFIEDQGRDRIASTSEELNRTIEQLVEQSDSGVFCRISKSNCSFRRDTFDPNSFLRHFRSDHPDEAIEKGFKRSQTELKRPKCPFGNQTFQSMVFENTLSDDHGIRCRIDGNDSCPYSQHTFHLMDYLRHFRRVHTEAARAKQFFRTAEETKPRHFVLTSQIIRHVIQTEHEQLRCGINPSERCEFTMEKMSSRDFLRHFCKHHTDEAEENGFLVEINRFSGSADSGPADSNDGAGPSASSFLDEEEDDPYVSDENTMEGVCDMEVGDSKIIEQQMDTPHEDPGNYCRLCFSVVLPLQRIFASQKEDRSLEEQIATCAGLNLSSESEPFASICSECVQKLDEIQRFRLLCHTLDKVVRGKKSAKQISTSDKVMVPTTDTMQDQPTGFVEDADEIQIKDELSPPAVEDDEDQTPPEYSIDLSDDLSQPEYQSAPEDPTDLTDDESPNHSFPCRVCGEKFSSARTMMQHYKEKHTTTLPLVFVRKYSKCTDYHNPDEPPKEKFYCTMPNCSQFFMGLILLRRHLKNFHGLTDPGQLELMSVLKQSK